ncbi:MAG: GMC family oxidoreductase [Janthinobacterium lividum]
MSALNDSNKPAVPHTFDFVVVGAGSAGCVLASRLSESGRFSVALLEAGGSDRNLWVTMPLAFGKLYGDAAVNWGYRSEPEPGLDGAISYQARGKLLGGTGSINGLTYMRGHRADYDRWRALGNVGWGYDDLLPYFRGAEQHVRGDGPYHGAQGPINVIDAPRHVLGEAFVDAAGRCGFPFNPDVTGESAEGFGRPQMTVRNGRRSSSAAEYLRPALRRSNLHVFQHCLVAGVVFENKVAKAVVFQCDGVEQRIAARCEVILCAGAFNSPQLLQRSGVGPADLLREHGIDIVADLPGVGGDLEDHFGVNLAYRCTHSITVTDEVVHPIRRAAMMLDYLVRRRGALAGNASYCIGFMRTAPHLPIPDAHISLLGWARGDPRPDAKHFGLYRFPAFTLVVSLMRPESRGSVQIRDLDPASAPRIRFNFFQSEADQQALLSALRIARRIMSSAPICEYVAAELIPGPAVQSDEEWLAFCRSQGRSTHHAAGTCKMGSGPRSVVDARLRVKGVRGLRVVDSSVMPSMVAGNINSTVIVIAEKGAAMILEDHKNPQ